MGSEERSGEWFTVLRFLSLFPIPSRFLLSLWVTSLRLFLLSFVC